MGFFWKKAGLATATLALALVAPRAEAAYLDPASWVGALSGAVAEYGAVSLSPFPAYSVTFQDSYGTWTPATQGDAVYVGPDANPYNPSGYSSRAFFGAAPAPSEGQLGATFTCHPNYYPCLGAFRAIFTLPYDIVGFVGDLSVGADYWPGRGGFMPELEIGEIIDGVEWKYPGASFFYGQMFDAPTNTFTVSWTAAAETNLDAFSHFLLSDAVAVRATAVPEPASAALFGIGLLGLGLARRHRAASRRG